MCPPMWSASRIEGQRRTAIEGGRARGLGLRTSVADVDHGDRVVRGFEREQLLRQRRNLHAREVGNCESRHGSSEDRIHGPVREVPEVPA